MRFDSVTLIASWLSAVCLTLFISCVPARAQKQDVYTVAKLSVDIKAKDAVTAKGKALAIARTQALHTVFRRITPFNSFDRLPVLSPAAIEDMLAGFSVRRERNSATRYIATLDFKFQPEAVRKLLSGKDIAISDQQAGRITVLPVYISKGKIDQSGRDPWRTAWLGLDLQSAIVPVKLARAGPSFTMDRLSGILGGDLTAFVAMREKYKTKKLVLAIAEPAADGRTLTTRLFGFDLIGSVSLARNDPVYSGNMKSAARDAAEITLGIFAGRWKLMQTPRSGSGIDTTPADVDVVVEFSGMREWKAIRGRLVKIPGVNGLDIKSLSARTAQLVFKFPGGAEGLARAVPDHGLSMHGAGNAWILRGN